MENLIYIFLTNNPGYNLTNHYINSLQPDSETYANALTLEMAAVANTAVGRYVRIHFRPDPALARVWIRIDLDTAHIVNFGPSL